MLKIDTKNALKSKVIDSYKKRIEKASEYLLAKKYSEFLTLHNQDLSPILNLAKELKGKFKDVVIVGIGGSILGTQMLHSCLYKESTSIPAFHFIDNIDPLLISSLEKYLDKKTTLFIIVSKSGSTLETATAFSLISKKVSKNQKTNIIIITENKTGLLYTYGEKNKIKTLEMPKFVSGRYSVLTSAGLLPAALMGIDIKKLLIGAKKGTETKNAETLAILIHNLYSTKKRNTMTLFPYIDSFEYFNKWVIQLIAESLGKSSTVGILPISLTGSKDQHSMLQLLIDGPKDKWVLFTELENREKDYTINGIKYSQILQAEKIGTEKSISEKHIQNATIKISHLDEENIGELIMTFEKAIALSGELLGVNAFNQPAVENSKSITKEILLKLKQK